MLDDPGDTTADGRNDLHELDVRRFALCVQCERHQRWCVPRTCRRIAPAAVTASCRGPASLPLSRASRPPAGVKVDRTTAIVLLKPAERVGHPMRLDHIRRRIHLERRDRLRLEELGKGRVTNQPLATRTADATAVEEKL